MSTVATDPTFTARSPIGSFGPDVFAAHLAAIAAAPAWWVDRQRAAYEKFAALPFPVRTDESWRFSNLVTLTLDGFALRPGEQLPVEPLPIASSAHLTFVNNRLFASAAPAAALIARGVIVTTLAEAATKHAELLRTHFMAQPQKLGSEKFAALHTAFVEDGAFIYIPRGVEVSAPIVITHAAVGRGAAVFPHTLVIAEENSKVTVVDYFISAGPTVGPDQSPSPRSDQQLAIGANDLYAGHGAQLTYVGAQDWARDTLSFQFNSTVVRRDARVQSLNLHIGARQARHESLSQLQAPGAFSEMLALTVASGAQEFDQRTLQIHQAPNTKSDLLYKNALRDRARTIFSGLIVVDPDAQKTDAYQSNRNLMLSEEAEASSLPGLEIQANDVRCTHGATSSRIDPEQEFYLQSRGIAKEAADELLTFGFFEEVLNRLTSDELHVALRTLIQTQFRSGEKRARPTPAFNPYSLPATTMTNRERTLSREVTATQIPSGDQQTLPANSRVFIHQTLGGSYTVQTDFGLFRIEGKDVDAIGEQVVDNAVKAATLADGAPDPEAIWAQLRHVFDPEIPVNIVDLGLVYSMDVEKVPALEGYRVNVAMTLTAPGCGMGPAIAEDAKSKILLVPGVGDADVRITWDPPWNQQMISEEGKMKLGLI